MGENMKNNLQVLITHTPKPNLCRSRLVNEQDEIHLKYVHAGNKLKAFLI